MTGRTTHRPALGGPATLAGGVFLAGLAVGFAWSLLLGWWRGTSALDWMALALALAALGLLLAALRMSRRRPHGRHAAADAESSIVDIAGRLDSAPDDDTEEIRFLAAERLGQMLDATAEGVLGLDSEGRIALANRAPARLLGVGDALALLGLHVARVAPPMSDGQPSPLVQAVKVRGAASAADDTLHRHDGTPFRARWALRRLPRSDEQDELAFVLSFDDVTDRLAREARFRSAQRMEVMGQMAGGIAHEFYNVLSSLLMSLELLALDAPPDTRGRRRHRELRDLIRGASDLVEHLVAFARPGDDVAGSCDLAAELRSLEPVLQRIAGESVSLHLNLPSQPVPAAIGPGALEQVVANLVLNSRDAMPGGGQLRIDVASTAGGPILRVVDDGRGMSEDVLEHALDPFFSTKDERNGSGLGLSTAYGIVLAARGDLEIASRPGEGTRVTVRLEAAELPAAGQPDRREATDEAAPPAGDGHGTILLVEDQQALREAVVEALERLGYRVLVAEDPRRAMALIQQEPGIDLLFTDVIMPHGNGYDLARSFLDRHPHARVLFTSGHDAPALQSRGELERWPMLRKPFRLRELAQILRKMM